MFYQASQMIYTAIESLRSTILLFLALELEICHERYVKVPSRVAIAEYTLHKYALLI